MMPTEPIAIVGQACLLPQALTPGAALDQRDQWAQLLIARARWTVGNAALGGNGNSGRRSR